MPSARANAYHERLFPGYVSKFPETDPEFIDRFDTFAFDEVIDAVRIPEPQRWRIVLALLIGWLPGR